VLNHLALDFIVIFQKNTKFCEESSQVFGSRALNHSIDRVNLEFKMNYIYIPHKKALTFSIKK